MIAVIISIMISSYIVKIISIIMNSGTWDYVVYHVKNGNWEMWINLGW
nr:MAG: hypothetical protein [Bacteriophage sp.]